MLSINVSELIWTIINFFLLLFLLKRFLYDPIIRFTEERQARIDAGFEAERKAQETVRENDARLAAEKDASRQQAKELLQQAERADEQRADQALAQARADAEQARKAAGARLEAERAEEEAKLAQAKAGLAELLAERILEAEE